jgi:hypothetical protein
VQAELSRACAAAVGASERSGAERDLRVPQGAWLWPTASPDGRRLALGRWEGARRTLWTLTLDTGAMMQVTYLDDTIGSRWMRPTADGSRTRRRRPAPPRRGSRRSRI